MNYRADIDGLRGFAVLSVVVFHAFPNWLRGGFVGVDVFFVISGFLITSIIFRELEDGKFSLAHFLSRRVRRIFPALILVMTASLIAAWFSFFAEEFAQLGKHVASGAGFVLNFVLVTESGYFDNLADTKPLLHLWSLAVEEQFYIFWPIVLLAAWRRHLNLLALTLTVGLISFWCNLLFVDIKPIHTFYWPLGRFWELLSGSALAWLVLNKHDVLGRIELLAGRCFNSVSWLQPTSLDSAIVANFNSIFGSLILVYGVIQIQENLSFPGIWAVVPVAGALLIIAAGPKSWFNSFFLMHPLAVWFGLISYPLYLWHWSILSFLTIIEGDSLPTNLRFGAIFLSIVLAWLTYILIEKPIRSNQRYSHGKATLVLIGAMLLVGLSGLMIWVNDGFGDRASIVRFENQQKEILFPDGACPTDSSVAHSCRYDNYRSSSDRVSIIIGDSHARQSFELLTAFTLPKGSSTIGFSFGGCPFLLEAKMSNVQQCDQVNRELLAYLEILASSHSQVNIYLAGQWSTYSSSGWLSDRNGQFLDFSEILAGTLNVLEPYGNVTILDQVPHVPFNPQVCAKRPFRSVATSRCVFTLEESDSILRESRAAIADALDLNIYAGRLNYDEVLCPDRECSLISANGALRYFDATHINSNAIN